MYVADIERTAQANASPGDASRVLFSELMKFQSSRRDDVKDFS